MVIDKLIYEIRQAAQYNSDVQVAPKVVLWPDGESLWEGTIEMIKEKLPELLILGEYQPENKKGPAIWLSSALDNYLNENIVPKGSIPVIYMPGISRSIFRDIANLPKELYSIADLQFRGCYFSQDNGKDVTPLSFLSAKGTGLNMNVKRDNETKDTLLKALPSILRRQQKELEGRPLDQEQLIKILTPDPERMLLSWLSGDNSYKETLTLSEWDSFCKSMQHNYDFSPNTNGILHAARLFSEAKDKWASVWQRYEESYIAFPGIFELLEKTPKQGDIYANAASHGNCPIWNRGQENSLNESFERLKNKDKNNACKQICELVEEHKERKSLIWFKMGKSPYLTALLELEKAVNLIEKTYPISSLDKMVEAYREWGWKVDMHIQNAVIPFATDTEAESIKNAIQSLYSEWLHYINQQFQAAVNKEGYPTNDETIFALPAKKSALIFVDGLRLDWAMMLKSKLADKGIESSEDVAWSVIPSITASGKAYVSPLKNLLSRETPRNPDFVPAFKDEDKKGSWANIKTQLKHHNWDTNITQNSTNNIWIECGNIDNEGHYRGWKLPQQMETILADIVIQVHNLLDKGFETIKIVTDHGWLYLPGGLNKQELPTYLTDNIWGRSALIKETATNDEEVYPWYWNPNVYFASPRGASCYRAGLEYAHGGVSLQECVTLFLKITNASQQDEQFVTIESVSWTGLRCRILANAPENARLDIREKPADPTSSVILKTKNVANEKQVSLLVEDEDLENEKAFVVIVDENGNLLAQVETKIGE